MGDAQEVNQRSPEVPFVALLALARNLRMLVVIPLVVALAAFGLTFFVAPTYIAVTRILPPAQQQSTSAVLAAQLGSLAGIVGSAAGIKNPAEQYAALLKSRTVYDAIIQRFNLRQVYDERYTEDARKELEKRVTVAAGSKDGIITIEVQDRDPKRAADIATAFVEELTNLSKNLAITEAAQRRLFFEEQLKATKDNLTRSQVALQSSGLSEATLKTMPQSALETLARLKAQITAQEIRLAAMRTHMTSANPEIRVATQELAALHTELTKAERSSGGKAAGEGAEYIAKYRDFRYHETLFELIAKQFELARLDEAREGAIVQVIDRAIPPERKSKPRRFFISVIAALSAFLTLIAWVLLREANVRTAPPANRPTLSDFWGFIGNRRR